MRLGSVATTAVRAGGGGWKNRTRQMIMCDILSYLQQQGEAKTHSNICLGAEINLLQWKEHSPTLLKHKLIMKERGRKINGEFVVYADGRVSLKYKITEKGIEYLRKNQELESLLLLTKQQQHQQKQQ